MKTTLCLAALAICLPAAIAVTLPLVPTRGPRLVSNASSPLADSPLPADTKLQLSPLGIAETIPWRPKIANVKIVDLDGDGRRDILACDAHRGQVIWHRQASRRRSSQVWASTPLADIEIPAPAHATPADLDGDGDLDVVVAVLGSVWPSDHRIGGVLWFEQQSQDGSPHFVPQWLLQDVRRVSDVQAGDLDGDGDLDLVVAEFGYHQGAVWWLENLGDSSGGLKFHERELLIAPGPIHVPIADFDGDDDLDFVALVSQEDEKVWAFENASGKSFEPRLRVLWSTPNFDFGSAGLSASDLDGDGDVDLLLVAGDNLETNQPYPQPWHGCLWLENQGDWKFVERRIATLGGAYAASAGDLDGDGDLDVAIGSVFNTWRDPEAASLIWLENDGQQRFRALRLATSPTHLATVDCGDLNGDGRDDIVAGGFHLTEPFDRLSELTLWLSDGIDREARAR